MERGPQFKIFHGNQGTLFNQQEHEAIQAQRVVSDEDRYPRGYTPERMREVKSALRYDPRHGGYGRVLTPNAADVLPHKQSAFKGHTGKDFERGPWMGRNEGSAKVAETVARSTMPIAWGKEKGDGPTIHIGGTKRDIGLGRVEGGFYQSGRSGGFRHEVFVGAKNHPDYDPEEPENFEPRTYKDDEAHMRINQQQTLIHELGHHHSNITGTEHSTYRTPTQRGAEEAYADDFKDEHFRPDPRDMEALPRGRTLSSLNAGHAYDAWGSTPKDPYGKSDEDEEHFVASYLNKRQHSLEESKTIAARLAEVRKREADNPKLFDQAGGHWSAPSETGYGGRRHGGGHWRVLPKPSFFDD